jgi:prepilin-type N-terminal cleavage/methylation domain-containing protein/prepilin-type processing-associated H-X9-DG protein
MTLRREASQGRRTGRSPFQLGSSTRARTCGRWRRGFTLVELLVVIAIIGVLVALLLPAVQAAREAARRTQCSNNLKNIGLALINHADAKKKLPAATQFRPGKGFPNPDSGPGGTWVLEILPFIEQQALYARFNRTVPVHDDRNKDLLGIPLPFLVCPSDGDAPSGGVFEPGVKLDGSGYINRRDVPQMGLWYPVSSGPTEFDGCPFCTNRPDQLNHCCQGASFGSRPVIAPNDPLGPPGTSAPTFAGLFGRWEKGLALREIGDGLTNVIMAGEQINGHCRYTCAHCPNFPFSATNIPINTMLKHPPFPQAIGAGAATILSNDPEIGGYAQVCGYKSRHPGGAHMLMADTSVHMVNEAIDFDVYVLLGSRNSGEVKRFP